MCAVMPICVAPPGSAGSSARPLSFASTAAKQRSKRLGCPGTGTGAERGAWEGGTEPIPGTRRAASAAWPCCSATRVLSLSRDPWLEPPIGLLAELTHRCPLQCPYCSNPVELEKAAGELTTEEWARVLDQADELGVLQLHLSGGEPAARRDLEAIVRHAAGLGLYTNLITSGVLLDERRVHALKDAGLDHVQLSLQGANPATAERVSAYRGGHAKKLEVARWVRAAGLPLTVNAVVHRQNLGELEAMVDLSLTLDAHRLEVAHVQYYGWALRNRAALMPTRAQLEAATATVARGAS